MESSNTDELFLVDGSGFIFRAYYALAYGKQTPMTNPEGTPVGAVYIFVNMLLRLFREYHAPYLAVIFDASRENFRNEIYSEYKANRNETPEDLIPQFPIIRDAVRAFDLPAIELEGYEADDLIAAYAKQARAQGKKVVIVSSDKDLMQLVGEGVRMLDPMKQKWIGPEDVMEKFGVTPDKVVDVQSLTGDPTDNVPGVPGIGVKTAAQLINEYGSLESLLERINEIKQPKRREILTQHAENARISKRLVALDSNAPLPLPMEELKTHDPQRPALTEFLQAHGFQSIIRRLGGGTDNASPAKSETLSENQAPRLREESTIDISLKDNQYTLITDEITLKAWIDDAYQTGAVAVDTETTNLTPAKAKLVGISLASRPGKAAYIPLGHTQTQDLFGDTSQSDIKQMDINLALQCLKPMLEDPSVLKIAHNMKYDWQMFAKEGIQIYPCDDTMLMSFVLDGATHSHSMDNLAKLYLDHDTIKYEDVAGKGKGQVTFDKVPIDKALNYAAEDADVTLRLHKILKPRIAQEKMASVYETIERPLITVIAEMELAGIKIDPAFLNTMSNEFGKKLIVLEQEIHRLAGCEFNVASPKQVGEILFGSMGLQGGKKTKTGDWATSVDVLEKLSIQGHTIADKILEHRQLAKLKSTYTDALQEEINPETKRVHTSFHMAGASTGRLASSNPNLQNIPIRTEEGRKIREAFIAEKGHVLLSVDYSQVELRLAAEMAGVEALKKAFKENIDIHSLTAAQVFGIPLEQVTSEIRRQAKAVNFGIIYGISGFGLARQLGTTTGEASDFIKRYLAKFHEIQTYMNTTIEEAKQNGFVKTLYGRKVFIPGIRDKNPARARGAERQAINAPLQGTAADIMKIAMVKIPRALKDSNLSAKMLLQVHDELIFEVPEAELDQTKTLIQNIMENAHNYNHVKIGVPLNTEAGAGASWGRAH